MRLDIKYKRVIFICILLCMSLGIYNIMNTVSLSSVQVNSMPITNKVVILDAGHRYPR